MLRKTLLVGVIVGAISVVILAGPTASAATGCVATVNRKCSWKATKSGSIEIVAVGVWRVEVYTTHSGNYVASQGTGAVSTLWPYIVKGDRIKVSSTGVAAAQQVGRV